MADHIFSELDKLDCTLPDTYKRNFIMLRIKNTAPEIYTSVAQDTEMNYHKTVVAVKKLAALNSAIDETVNGAGDPTGAFFTTTKREMEKRQIRQSLYCKRWTPKQNQCFWCLKMGHGVANCLSRKRGQKAKQRPDGTYFKNVSKADKGDYKSNSPTPQSFQAFSFNVEAKPGGSEWLIDSGCNKHMTPYKEDLRELEDSKIVCTFGNNEVLRAEGIGCVEVDTETEKQERVKIILTDVLYVPGLPQRMLSTGQLRRSGGEFIESDMRKSVLVMPDRHTIVSLRKRGDYLWLSAKHRNTATLPLNPLEECNNPRSATAYAPGHRDTASASLIDWL